MDHLKNFLTYVMNNGTSTGYFSLERETRQSDPLSSYLFILTFSLLGEGEGGGGGQRFFFDNF